MACRWQRGCRDAIALIPVTARPGPRAPCGWLVALPSPLSPGMPITGNRAAHGLGTLRAGCWQPELLGREPPACQGLAGSQSLAEIWLQAFGKDPLLWEGSAPKPGCAAGSSPWERGSATFLIPRLPWVEMLQPLDPRCSHTR